MEEHIQEIESVFVADKSVSENQESVFNKTESVFENSKSVSENSKSVPYIEVWDVFKYGLSILLLVWAADFLIGSFELQNYSLGVLAFFAVSYPIFLVTRYHNKKLKLAEKQAKQTHELDLERIQAQTVEALSKVSLEELETLLVERETLISEVKTLENALKDFENTKLELQRFKTDWAAAILANKEIRTKSQEEWKILCKVEKERDELAGLNAEYLIERETLLSERNTLSEKIKTLENALQSSEKKTKRFADYEALLNEFVAYQKTLVAGLSASKISYKESNFYTKYLDLCSRVSQTVF